MLLSCARTYLLLLRNPTMNAYPRVMVDEAVTTTVARARLVLEEVAEPARTSTMSQVLTVCLCGALQAHPRVGKSDQGSQHPWAIRGTKILLKSTPPLRYEESGPSSGQGDPGHAAAQGNTGGPKTHQHVSEQCPHGTQA